MRHLLPRWLFRLVAPAAHMLRHRWRLLRGSPIDGATMIARDLQGRVLLVRHTYGPEGWYCPGGGIGRGETPEDAAVRELLEETGCGAEGVSEVGRLDETLSGSPHTAYVFTCTTQDMPRLDGREIAEARFFPSHSLPEPLGRLTRARLALWQRGGADPA